MIGVRGLPTNYLYDWLNLIEEVDSIGNVLTRRVATFSGVAIITPFVFDS
jgi:hypothetical protein